MRIAALSAMAALATQLLGCGSLTQTHPARSTQSARLTADTVMRRLAVRDPPTFLDVEYTDTGSPRAIELRSPVSGNVAKMLAAPPDSVDYQGGALSLDGRYAYVASIGWIDRITIASDVTQRVAEGQNPAISPDGRSLAYMGRLGSTPAVLNLSTGVARTIDLAGLTAGPDDSITWLGDSHTLVLAPQPPFDNTHPEGNCGNGRTSVTCLIIVDLAARAAARRVVIPGKPGVVIQVSGVDTQVNTLLLARGFAGGRSTLTRAVITHAGARAVQELALGQRSPVAFAPTGRRIIYQTDEPRALWSATISQHQLTRAHRLTGRGFWGAAAAW